MTIDAHKKLILRINEALSAKTAGGTALALAQEYTGACGEAASRLDRCSAMLAKGSEYQAVQLAEEEPGLLEVAGILSFPRRAEWVARCREQEWPVPSEFETNKIQALEAVYSRGITTSHPLYAEYRAAISKRNDAAALRVIRTIARLNPMDANATEQQQRLEEKRIRETAAQLQTALQHGDESQAARLTLELQALAPAQRLAAIPHYEDGCAVQQKVAREHAAAFVKETLHTLHHERPGNDWQAASATLARIEQTCLEHDLAIPAEVQPLSAELHTWVTAEEARAAEDFEFRRRLNDALALAAEVHGRHAVGGWAVADVRGLLVSLEQAWEAVVRCEKAVDADHQQRVEAAARALREEADRLTRRRRLTLITLSAAVAALLAVCGWVAWSFFTASSHAARLAELQETGKVIEAEKLLGELDASRPALSAWAGLDESMKKAATWARGERHKLAAAESALTELEDSAANAFPGLNAGSLATAWQGVDKLAAALLPQLRAPLEVRLAQLQNKADARLTALKGSGTQSVQKKIAELEEVQKALKLEALPHELREAITTSSPILQQLQQAVAGSPEFPEGLPDAEATKIKTLQKQNDEYAARLVALDKAEAALAAAVSLDEFRVALGLFKNIDLKAVDSARSAAAAGIPDPPRLIAAALYDDKARQDQFLRQDPAATLYPKVALEPDKKILQSLLGDTELNQIYEIRSIRLGTKQTGIIYSRGMPKPREGDEDKPFEKTTFTGLFYRPSDTDTCANFVKGLLIPSAYDEYTRPELSKTSQLLASLKLAEGLLDEQGNYTRNIFYVFSRLATNSQAPAAARFAIWTRLAPIVELNPAGWGLDRSPSLQRDFKAARDIPPPGLVADRWMTPKGADPNSGEARFFAALKKKFDEKSPGGIPFSYTIEAEHLNDAEKRVRSAGAKYAGYVDIGERVILTADARRVSEFWVLDRTNDQARLVRPAPDGSVPEKLPAFTPVFYIPGDRQKALGEYKNSWAAGRINGPFYR